MLIPCLLASLRFRVMMYSMCHENVAAHVSFSACSQKVSWEMKRRHIHTGHIRPCEEVSSLIMKSRNGRGSCAIRNHKFLIDSKHL